MRWGSSPDPRQIRKGAIYGKPGDGSIAKTQQRQGANSLDSCIPESVEICMAAHHVSLGNHRGANHGQGKACSTLC
jgi:hypothetical protein